jgi:hypothetical protein
MSADPKTHGNGRLLAKLAEEHERRLTDEIRLPNRKLTVEINPPLTMSSKSLGTLALLEAESF